MPTPRVMFVSHTGQMAGAELVLLDVVKPWVGATAFLFEDGPLHQALVQSGLSVRASRWGRGLANVQRDNSLAKAIPLGAKLVALVADLARAARRHDVVYANSQKAFVMAAAATALARRPLVWHLHDIMNAAHFGRGQRKLQITLANARASRVIVPSQAAAAAFVAEGGRQNLVDVVANGLDIAPDMTSRAELRRHLDLPHGPLVGVFSRLAAWKGQHVVLQALVATPGVACVIAGDALFGEQAYAAQLRRLADDLGIADRVHFLGHRSDVATVMRAVDVMIHPSVDPEPFGRTLVEAMLAGTPVIATDAGAASEILDGGRAGTLIPPGDAPALAAAIVRVLRDTDEIAARCDDAQRRARALYNTATMQASINAVIARAANGSAS